MSDQVLTNAAEGVGLARSSYYYQAHPRDDRAERMRIREIAETRVRYGMWRIHTLMRREGWLINHRSNYLMLVNWARKGVALYAKRLERGRSEFPWPERLPIPIYDYHPKWPISLG